MDLTLPELNGLPARWQTLTTADFTPVPRNAQVLGEVDGITYIKMPNGDVWKRAVVQWEFFATPDAWPHTATYRALSIQQARTTFDSDSADS